MARDDGYPEPPTGLEWVDGQLMTPADRDAQGYHVVETYRTDGGRLVQLWKVDLDRARDFAKWEAEERAKRRAAARSRRSELASENLAFRDYIEAVDDAKSYGGWPRTRP